MNIQRTEGGWWIGQRSLGRWAWRWGCSVDWPTQQSPWLDGLPAQTRRAA